MKRWFAENLGWKLFSLAVAVALWLTFVGRPDLVTSIWAPVEYFNVPAELEIVPEFAERVRLEVRGPAGRVRQFEESSPAVVLDLTGIDRPGERTFSITREQVSLPAGLTLVRAAPAQVRLRFDRRLRRVVPVRPQFSDPPPGHRIESVHAEPSELAIVGPESRVRRVQFVETDPVDLRQAAGAQEFQTHVFVRDPEVRLETARVVKVHVKLARRTADTSSDARTGPP